MSRPDLVIFGEVLFDRFPDGSRILGGAPFNVAWHCQAFGLSPLLISRVGNDPLGREVRSAMIAWGMDTSGLQLDSTHATGIVDVDIHDGEPSYNIVEDSAWDFIDNQATPAIDNQGILYHGSLATRNPVSDSSLADLRKQYFNSIFIDINLRPPWWNLSVIEKVVLGCRWIKLNAEELASIVPQERGIEARARVLLSQAHAEMVVVTRGDAGAMAFTQEETHQVSPDSSISIVDTVGAGDAFSSVLLLGLKRLWPLRDTLNRAQQFASAIVEQRGATTQDKEIYEPFIRNWCL